MASDKILPQYLVGGHFAPRQMVFGRELFSRADPMFMGSWPVGQLDPGFLGPGIGYSCDWYPGLGPVTASENLGPMQLARTDVASLLRFSHRVDFATFHLCVAFEKADVRDFALSAPCDVLQSAPGINTWYAALVNATFNRYRDLRNALTHRWTPPAEVEPLRWVAFLALCDLTPAGSQLRSLFAEDASRATHELVRHLDIVADQLKAAIQLAANLKPAVADDELSEDQARLDSVQQEILQKAGEPMSLTGAAGRLGISRQALHKRIQNGSALGLMRGSELVIPGAQLMERDGKPKIVDGLSEIVALFDKAGAGRWSALQFLIEVDPLLKAQPLDRLKQGKVGDVVAATRAYLNLDEG